MIEGVVNDQIQIPRRGSIMQPDLVKGDDRRDVAAYVASVAGKPGQDTGLLASVGGNKNANKVAVEKGGKLTIPADPSGALAYPVRQGARHGRPGDDRDAEPGAATAQHRDHGPGERQGPHRAEGRHSSFKVTLKPGNYTFLCDVPGHAAAA